MRTFIVLVICMTALGFKAQTIKTVTFTVKGNCEDCKERIENSADIKGVKICTWDEHTKVASVTYDTAKTDLFKIQEAIAAKGHDAGDVKGDKKAYNKLPDCCKYHDGKCEEKKK
jgi:hypothetical protein